MEKLQPNKIPPKKQIENFLQSLPWIKLLIMYLSFWTSSNYEVLQLTICNLDKSQIWKDEAVYSQKHFNFGKFINFC